MTKSNIAFAQFVNSIMASERITHSEAWLRAAQLKPDLNTLMLALGATRQRVDFLNSEHHAKVECPSAESRIVARDEFLSKVRAKMAKSNLDYDAAWRSCEREFPNAAPDNFYGRRTGWTKDAPGHTDAVPKFGDYNTLGNVKLYCLPPGTSQEIFNVAYKANGSQSGVIYFAKVFDGLVNHFMEANKLSHDSAIAYCKENFPDLWAIVKKLAE